MLSEFKDKQLLAYNLFVKDIENSCVTHAYLIDENNYCDSFKMVMSFVKSLLCSNSSDNINCNQCSICKRIDDGNYPEVKIICSDGMYIKKQQVIDLQQEFSRSAVEGKKRIYIIRDCEKMRTEAANSMLKFLEEPEEGVIAILMTNNINSVLTTIISRCKLIKLNSTLKNVVEIDEVLENLAIDFVFGIENRGIDMILDVKDLWFSKITSKDRDKMIIVFDLMIDIYYDILKVVIVNNDIRHSKWFDKIMKLAKLNKLDELLEKIKILMEAKDSIKFNVNSNLLIDNVVVSIGGIIDDSRY